MSRTALRRYASTGWGRTITGSARGPSCCSTGAARDADAIIDKIRAAVASYPYRNAYRAWPGPNSNTFIAYVARQVPELGLGLPANAIGKDFLPGGALIAAAPSGTGFQLSLYGLAGILVAAKEGVEINVLGLATGIDAAAPALKLPAIGRLGFRPRIVEASSSAAP